MEAPGTPGSATKGKKPQGGLTALVASLEAELLVERNALAAERKALAVERNALAAERERSAMLERERDKLREAYERLRLELELARRRLVVAKAERVDTTQLELEFADKLKALDELSARLDGDKPSDDGKPDGKPSRPRPTGRRDLSQLNLPEERIVIGDPRMDEAVARGEAEAIGFEESNRLAWKRGGLFRVVVARVKYRVAGQVPETTDILTAATPPEAFPRSLAAPSLLAHIATDKHCDGLPLHRQEDRFSRDGVPLDRGTMCRWLEDLGSTVGATIIEAARQDALRRAFCMATDGTGVLVQPERSEQKRQPCRRGHYTVQIADRDHVFFEYTPRETSASVSEMFRGFSRYVQADAASVHDILFRPPDDQPPDEEARVCTEVGCWSHCRRHFWEAAVARSAVGREGLARIGRLFNLERKWQGRPAVEVKALREEFARPHVEAFFAWAEAEHELVRHERGLLRSALGYAVRQKAALMRYLDDGRLVLDNNRSERELRRIAVGRKAWLFVGSDDHAQAAGNLFSMIASARLHGLDPEAYLRDIIRVLGHWPRDRYLELSALHWRQTRARLDEAELSLEVGPLTIPPPLSPPEEK